MARQLDVHFHCPDCGPLVLGQTRAICGRIIRPLILGAGPERKCPDCKTNRRSHRKEHH
ncbi:hypothetical protein ACFW2I_08965 [Streptomyces nigra]|uniref:hypothetical protein n=1 Tax=Streptomyces nigra TaxID=1827580 RepID=UPI003696E045